MARKAHATATKPESMKFTASDRRAIEEVREAIARGETDEALSQVQVTALLKQRKRRQA